MPHSFGYRANTRTLFRKDFRKHGRPHSTTYLRSYKRGDYVDIKVDASQHKGMPFKHYHGRTGVVFNVNKRAVGIIVNKQVNGRIIPKRLHVSIPHVLPSKCRDGHIARVKKNEELKKAAKAQGEIVELKRKPTQPKAGYFYSLAEAPTSIQPLVYVDLV
jgi:large subunit ribosomal protein L21e